MRHPLWGHVSAALALAAALLVAQSAGAAPANCHNTGSFDAWLAKFKQEAEAQGISRAAIAEASPYMVYDQRIVNIDRGQKFFAQDFLQFSDKMLAGGRIGNGVSHIKKYADIFAREEKEYGVPPAVITGFWGLESDFGSNQGKDNSIRSLTTLAYDCRRSDMFRGHLFDGLRLIERGDLRPAEMLGSWAGELGQTQMMPSEYIKHAVDYDGDGRRNLIRSVPDVIGSTGNYLVSLGWKRGQPWLQEVRVSSGVPWDQADLAIQHPRAQWAKWGVTYPGGRALPADELPASLLLPMGRYGPAFLAYDNFQVYLKWNASLVYSTTAAYYATRLAGAPAVTRSSGPIPPVSAEEVREIQQLLTRAGFDVGGADGKVGISTRAAIKKMQLKFGLPADSYPTPELLAHLRGGR
ncbi:MAG TPA: lytic murein transglycosylase [Xanthobacteraceae bacterium]|nr:lytic murein transglycosylase [Xanthobacteraceae bacterium]